MDKSRQAIFIMFSIIGFLDFYLWVVIVVESEIVFSPVLFLFCRLILISLLYLILHYKLELRTLHSFGAALLFTFFSIPALIGMFILQRNNGEKKRKGSLLYHIDKEEGENEEDLNQHEEFFNIEELRRVAPLVDGLTSKSKTERVAAIQAMEQIDDFTCVRDALLHARKDPNKEVQYFANDALKKINESYIKKIKNLQEEINNESDPPQEKFVALADCYAAVAKAGIDHPVLLKFYSQEAINYYHYVLENTGFDKNITAPLTSIWRDVLPNLISVLYYNRNYESCMDYCEKALQEEGLKQLSTEYKARCLFRKKKLSGLKNFAQETTHLKIASIENFLALTEIPNG